VLEQVIIRELKEGIMAQRKDDKNALYVKEYEGNSVEEAIRSAMQELGLPKEKITIKILSEGQRGLFGMQGVKKAKIRVTVLSNDQKPA
jgi:Predicted RNA-binding protein